MTEAGASEEEIKNAISDAIEVRNDAKAIMESHGLQHLGMASILDSKVGKKKSSRVTELVSIAAAFALNCTSSLENHIEAARKLGVNEEEIKTVLNNAHFIKGEAAHYVEEMVKLEKKYDELQDLYDELQNTQAILVQSEKMAALGKLVATVLHEMNTPIGVIHSNMDTTMRLVERLIKIVNTSETRDEIITNTGFQKALNALQETYKANSTADERISNILKSLKSFSHLDEAPFQKINIHECIENVLTLLDSDFGERITVIKAYSQIPDTPCYPGELSQVFMHILSNAAEAIKNKGEIKIKTYLDNSVVKVEISDNGCGISPCKLDNLFDPDFSQMNSRVKARLGLFTSYNIMKKHQGSIEVKSEEGKGSTFTISFPANLVEEKDVTAFEKPQKTSSGCDQLGD